MASRPCDYDGFESSDETYKITGTTVSVIVYKGIPLDGDPDDRRFLRVGVLLKNHFISLEDFDKRCGGAMHAHDYGLLSQGNSEPFSIWLGNGGCVALPAQTFFARIAASDDLATWSVKQTKRWAVVMKSVQKATAPGNPLLARFLPPRVYAAAHIVFSTTESAAFFDVVELKTHVEAAAKAGLTYSVKSWAEAKADSSLVLLSTSPFGFYHTFISSADYELVCTNAATNPLEREWPGFEAGKVDPVKLAEELGIVGKDTDDAKMVDARITLSKINGARGLRSTVPGQDQVVGNSATKIAERLWPQPSASKTHAAEWLHRVAFGFGGLGDSSDYASAQQKRNLVFGTYECNSAMIRAENAISSVMDLLPSTASGILETENILSGSVERRSAKGRVEAVAIPKWMEDRRAEGLWWLCMRLKYQFIVKDTPLNVPLAMECDFDPFSRYVPFRIEGVLDNAMLKSLMARSDSDAPPAKRPRVRAAGHGRDIASDDAHSSESSVRLNSLESRPASPRPSLPVEDHSPGRRALTPAAAVRGVVVHHSASSFRAGTFRVSEQRLDISVLSLTGGVTHQQRAVGSAPHGSDRVLSSMSPRPRENLARPPSSHRGPQPPTNPSSSAELFGAALFGAAYPEPSEPVTPTVPDVRIHCHQVDGALVLHAQVYRHTERRTSALTDARGPRRGAHPTAHFAYTRSPLLHRAGPPDATTVRGKIALFGNADLTADFATWSGPVPSGASPDSPAWHARAIVTGTFRLSSILPVLQGSLLDSLFFDRVVFTHQNAPIDSTKAIGWHVDADFRMTARCGTMYSFLHRSLGLTPPLVRLHAGLGMQQSWQEPLRLHSFAMEGTFPCFTARLCEGMTMASIGVEIFGVRCITSASKLQTGMTFGFGLFGTIDVMMPGRVLPLEFEYKIREIGPILQLRADICGEIWEAPLGIKGLRLSEVSLSATLQANAPMRSFVFDVSAVFAYGPSVCTLTGAYTGAGLVLSAVIEEFDLHSLCDIYAAITGADLALPAIDVAISQATITVSSSDGLTLVLHDLRVDEYLVPDAVLHIDHAGVSVKGLLRPANVRFGDIELCSACLELRLSADDLGVRSSVALGGQVSFDGFELTALVHLSRAGTSRALDWTLYGNLATECPLSRLLPQARDSPLGSLVLTNVAFVVSSKDDPDTAHDLFLIPYRVRKGVQVCAMLSPIPMLDDLLRRPSKSMRGLVLSAAWSRSTGFEIDISLPGDAILDLGHGIRTEPFSLSIHADPRPQLVLTAGLRIPAAPPKGQALTFELSLSIDTTGAEATAQMHGYWENPLGLGQDVAIGPDVALSIGIVYAQFMTTGTPSQFAVGGGLRIGSVAAHMLMQLSEDPSRQLLLGSVNELGTQDIVAFARMISRISIPKVPEVVQFKHLSLYVCPSGTTIAEKTYPQGFSFEGTMIVFNHSATVACEIADGNVRVKGEIDGFTLGPLSVRGAEKSNPSVDVTIGPSQQRIFIDGSISVFEATTAIHIEVQIMPSPVLNCYMNLRFTEHFTFAMEARLLGTLSFNSLDDADLEFSADMQQDVLQYVRREIDRKLAAFQKTTAEDVHRAQAALTEAKRKADADIDVAQKKLDAAERSWQQKYHEIVDKAQAVIDKYLDKLRQLESGVRDAQASYDKDLRNAEKDVHEANVDRAAAMHEAETALEDAKHDATNTLNGALRDLERAKEDMQRQFGHALKDIDEAKEKVEGINHEIQNLEADMARCNNLPWYNEPLQSLGIYLCSS